MSLEFLQRLAERLDWERVRRGWAGERAGDRGGRAAIRNICNDRNMIMAGDSLAFCIRLSSGEHDPKAVRISVEDITMECMHKGWIRKPRSKNLVLQALPRRWKHELNQTDQRSTTLSSVIVSKFWKFSVGSLWGAPPLHCSICQYVDRIARTHLHTRI